MAKEIEIPQVKIESISKNPQNCLIKGKKGTKVKVVDQSYNNRVLGFGEIGKGGYTIVPLLYVNDFIKAIVNV
jgi:hypothetical protein